MPSPIPVVLDHLRFASQNQARQHFSDMLHRYQPGQRLNPADTSELQSLLKRHPLHGKTSPSNLKRINVTQAGFGRHCFSTVQDNDSKRNVSFVQCVRNCRDHPEPEASSPEPKKIAPASAEPPSQPLAQEPAQAKPPAPAIETPALPVSVAPPAAKPTPQKPIPPSTKKDPAPAQAAKPKKERPQ